MRKLSWKGQRPTPALTRALRSAGWQVDSGGAASIAVARTTRARLSEPPAPESWIWLTDEQPSAAAIEAAAENGALDVVCTLQPGWQERLLRRLAESITEWEPLPDAAEFVAESAAAQALLRKIAQAARTSMPVLLTGETGTGKELAARLIHQWSARSAHAFVPINCAAIPNELMEGELFGYAKGAFSGAVRDYSGLVAAAEGGTVFLDEIDDTPHALQQKLLRVLEDRVVARLGENVWHKVDFRLLAATNRDLRLLIEQGSFGEDLYERLATVLIELPPLRERVEDFAPLVRILIDRYYLLEEGADRPRVQGVTPEALEVLRSYHWPGNVRELRNVIFGALVTKRAGEELLVSDLPRRLWRRDPATRSDSVISEAEVERRIAAGTMNLKEEIEHLERVALRTALRHGRQRATAAARLLGEVGRGAAKDPGGTVRTMMKRLGLKRTARPPRIPARPNKNDVSR